MGVYTPPYVLTGIEDLQLELEDLQAELRALSDNAGASQDKPLVLLVGNDLRWLQDIVAEVALTFGQRIVACHPLEITERMQTLDLDKCQVSVIDLPSSDLFTEAFALGTWLEFIARISALMPIILLTSKNTQQIKILTRHSLSDPNDVIIDTIDTDYYDHRRLIKAFKKALA